MTYYYPKAGLPSQARLFADKAVFTEAYVVIPKGVLRDITASFLPHWVETRLWVLARPMTGFSETFSHYIMEVAPNGGSTQPEENKKAEAILFVVKGELDLVVDKKSHNLEKGSYAYLPAGTDWQIKNNSNSTANFHWIRKLYQEVDGVSLPTFFVVNEKNVKATEMPDTNGVWSTTTFVESTDLRHDMHVNIVNFEAGGVIPFAETHVMEHGLYMLEGKAAYYLNQDWVEVEAGDYLWLRAFCPQACYAGGPGKFRYLLYKDVNRHAPLQI